MRQSLALPGSDSGFARSSGVNGRDVLSSAEVSREFHHRADALAHLLRRGVLAGPDGQQHGHHVGRCDPVDALSAEARDAEGKAIPYGVYDMARNEAWVSVGCDHDTPTFAVASIRHWWQRMGQSAYPDATTLYITADAGGSNGYRLRSWKHELQKLADETRLTIQVSHFPPGTSKWNNVPRSGWRGDPAGAGRLRPEAGRRGASRPARGARGAGSPRPGTRLCPRVATRRQPGRCPRRRAGTRCCDSSRTSAGWRRFDRCDPGCSPSCATAHATCGAAGRRARMNPSMPGRISRATWPRRLEIPNRRPRTANAPDACGPPIGALSNPHREILVLRGLPRPDLRGDRRRSRRARRHPSCRGCTPPGRRCGTG